MNASVARIGAIVRKEFRHLVRDPRMMAVTLLLPIIELVLFANAISFDVHHIPLAVVDQDRTAASRAYLANFTTSDLFTQTASAGSVADVDSLFQAGSARAAVVVPRGFADDLQRGAKPQVAVVIDGSDTNSARVARTYAAAIDARYAGSLRTEWMLAQGQSGSFGTLDPRIRTWYNPDRISSIFLIPGLIVVIIMIVTVQQTAVSLVRERDQGTQEQMAVSPLRRPELMIGKLLPWTLLAFVDLVVIAAVGMLFFGVPLRGSVPFLVVAALVFVFCALGMGLVISALATSIEVANMVALLLSLLPAFLLSGFAFPISTMPTAIQWITYLFPGRYMVAITQGVFLKGGSWGTLWSELLGLGLYALATVVVASIVTRRRSA